MSEEGFSLWMRVPPTAPDRPGFSRIASNLPEDLARQVAEYMHFDTRAMPDKKRENE